MVLSQDHVSGLEPAAAALSFSSSPQPPRQQEGQQLWAQGALGQSVQHLQCREAHATPGLLGPLSV